MSPEDTRMIESSAVLAAARTETALHGVHVETSDYKGRVFRNFYAARDSVRPGWFVLGKGEEYGGRLRMIVARPDKPVRQFPLRNGKMHGGWRTKRDAQTVADALNRNFTA